MASHASALQNRQCRFVALRKTAAPACYFFQLLLLARMLIVEETSREALIRGSPNRRGLNSFPSSGSVGDLDRIGLPGGSIWIHNRRLRTAAIQTEQPLFCLRLIPRTGWKTDDRASYECP